MTSEKQYPDWDRIQIEYRTGVSSVNAIAASHGVPEATLRYRAKAGAWIRSGQTLKREMVKAAMSGVPTDMICEKVANLANEAANSAFAMIHKSAAADIQDEARGLEINRKCLVKLEAAAEMTTDPREIKMIVEAANTAILSIRRIRELDQPAPEQLTGLNYFYGGLQANLEPGAAEVLDDAGEE